MEPTLRSGQYVLVSLFKRAGVDSVVVAIQNSREVIKRVSHISDNGQVTLLGDNLDASTDSRTHGTIPLRHVLGVVVWPNTKHRRR